MTTLTLDVLLRVTDKLLSCQGGQGGRAGTTHQAEAGYATAQWPEPSHQPRQHVTAAGIDSCSVPWERLMSCCVTLQSRAVVLERLYYNTGTNCDDGCII